MTLDLAEKQAAANSALEEFGSETDRTFSPDSFLLWIHENRLDLLESAGEPYLRSFARGYVQCIVAPP